MARQPRATSDGDGASVLVDDGELALGVGAQEGELARLAQAREKDQQLVRVHDRRRHERGRLVRRVAEHHPLIAGALLLGLLAVDALRDVRALAVERAHVVERVPAEALGGPVVADVLHNAAGDLLRVDRIEPLAGDLAHVDHEPWPAHGLAGHVGAGVLGEAGVQHGVRDLVCHFVGVSFRNRLGSENVPSGMFRHFLVTFHFFVLAKRIRGRIPHHRGVTARLARPRLATAS